MSNILIRHASPEYSDNLYEDYRLGGLLQKDFKLSSSGREAALNSLVNLNCEKILYSPATVCQQTAQIISEGLRVEMFDLSELRTVKHDFSQFTDSSLWINGQPPDESEMQRLRRNSIVYFLEDSLLESKQALLERFTKLKIKLEEERSTLFISHGYTLKLFYLYLRTEFNVSTQEFLELAEVDKPFGESLQGFEYPSLRTVNF